MNKKIETALAVKPDGKDILKLALEARNDQFKENVVTFVTKTMEMREVAIANVERWTKINEFYTAQLEAISKNQFEIVGNGFIKFKDESLWECKL